jgi:hypothetical protein
MNCLSMATARSSPIPNALITTASPFAPSTRCSICAARLGHAFLCQIRAAKVVRRPFDRRACLRAPRVSSVDDDRLGERSWLCVQSRNAGGRRAIHLLARADAGPVRSTSLMDASRATMIGQYRTTRPRVARAGRMTGHARLVSSRDPGRCAPGQGWSTCRSRPARARQ